MATVREAAFELFRAHGMTTVFGNPGSTELPMLSGFPEDFTYVLGLQELAVVRPSINAVSCTVKPLATFVNDAVMPTLNGPVTAPA